MTKLVPYSFDSPSLPDAQSEGLPGIYQGVHFTMSQDYQEFILEKIEQWFEQREEVIFVSSGITNQELGYIMLEWEYLTIDRLFLDILANDELIEDFTVYNRAEEV